MAQFQHAIIEDGKREFYAFRLKEPLRIGRVVRVMLKEQYDTLSPLTRDLAACSHWRLHTVLKIDHESGTTYHLGTIK